MRYDPRDPAWLGRDRFVLSCGHASMLLYSMLHLAGYDLPLSRARALPPVGEQDPGAPRARHDAGRRDDDRARSGRASATRSGMALALKMKQARFGEPYAQSRVFCLASDGDLMEGVSARPRASRGTCSSTTCVVIYDDNHITIEGDTALAYSRGRLQALRGVRLVRAVARRRARPRRRSARRSTRRSRTRASPASSARARTSARARRTSTTRRRRTASRSARTRSPPTKKHMGFDPAEVRSTCPTRSTALFKERAAELAKEHDAWTRPRATPGGRRNAGARGAARRLREEDRPGEPLRGAPQGDPREGRRHAQPLGRASSRSWPSSSRRSSAARPTSRARPRRSSRTAGASGPGKFAGRNMHWGIREHGMGAVCNGMALSGGIIPFGATFLIFSDYMRPARPPLGARSSSSASGCTRTTRSSSARTGRRTSRSSSSGRCASSRTSTSRARPTRSSAPRRGRIAMQRKHGPTAFALTRQKLPEDRPRTGVRPRGRAQGRVHRAGGDGREARRDPHRDRQRAAARGGRARQARGRGQEGARGERASAWRPSRSRTPRYREQGAAAGA